MTTTEKPASLAEALALLQTRLPQINKSETATVRSDKGNYTYTYANLADISAAVLPLLGEVGLSFLTKPTFTADGRFVLAYALIHVSGEREYGEYPLPSGVLPQHLGSAITYARRYTLCAVTGAAADDSDDDGQAAQGAVKQQQGTGRRQQAAKANGEPKPEPDQDVAQNLASKAVQATAIPTLKAVYELAKTQDLLRVEIAHPENGEWMPLLTLLDARRKELEPVAAHQTPAS
ncbi:MAG: ERF family protein [Acidimicrobiales bacterium]